jgi:hypothetical protein
MTFCNHFVKVKKLRAMNKMEMQYRQIPWQNSSGKNLTGCSNLLGMKEMLTNELLTLKTNLPMDR